MKAIGIDLDSDVIKLCIMSKNKDLISMKSLDVRDIPNSDVKKIYMPYKDTFLITSALDASDVMIKGTDFHVKNSFFIKKAIKFHEESITTLDADKIITATINLKNESKLKIFITTKELLIKHLSSLKHINIDPDRVTSISQALIRFVNFYFKDIKNSFLVHISKSKTTCILMKDNQPIKTYSIKIGTNKLLNSNEDENRSKN